MKISCPSIASSIHAQEKLVENGICEILGGRKPIKSFTFTVIFPPCQCHKRYCPIHDKKDIPVILGSGDMVVSFIIGKILYIMAKRKKNEYVELFDALAFLKFTDFMGKHSPEELV